MQEPVLGMAAARIVVIDSQIAGISGDMLMSSLVDAGASKDKIIDAIFACQNFLKGSKITKASFEKTLSRGLSATRLDLVCKDRLRERKGVEMYRAIAAC